MIRHNKRKSQRPQNNEEHNTDSVRNEPRDSLSILFDMKDVRNFFKPCLSELAVALREGDSSKFSRVRLKLLTDDRIFAYCLQKLLDNTGIRTPGYGDLTRLTTINNSWWCVRKEHRKQQRYANFQNLFVTQPSSFKVSIPPYIIYRSSSEDLSLSAYHPKDSGILRSFALKWKPGIYKKVLKKTHAVCYLCGCDLLNEKFALHYIISPLEHRAFNIKYLLPLCISCHKRATAASRDTSSSMYTELKAMGLFVDLD